MGVFENNALGYYCYKAVGFEDVILDKTETYSVLDEEYLAFPIRTEKGEEDGFIIYPNPDQKVLERLRKYKTRTELWDDLPTDLDYIS